MADIGMPKIDIVFRGLGTSAVQRSSGGRTAVLIIKDDTDTTSAFAEYRGIDDLTTEEQAKYTPENVQYIKEALEGIPKRLIVVRMAKTLEGESSLTDLLKAIKGKVEMNCWIGMADATQQETDDLVSFVKSSVTNDKKRYKALVYKATKPDDMHIVNLTNEGENKSIPYMLGYLAGLSLDMSAIAKPLKIDSVIEPDDLDTAINNGEFILYNDEGEVRVARGINSLVTTGQGITDDMKFILIVEVMDMIYTDIYTTWKRFYKGKYKNSLDNQMLLIGAINSYFKALANDLILDPNFENKTRVDVEKQRLANIPKYGEEEVATWDDNKIMEMTVGTNVFLAGNIKILNAMEDFDFEITM
ncbi:phage tail sheath C-terminal domain-containing protein [Anaerosalibacter sp. Marseille-P3206]|uniref:phage tail sheath C-terminal domain-containing protein n=1 Tax=Anaerosalibacter sp. Marseille-P3206 TaxID=1871005 RepID=UPI0009844E4B|nr:phage tail sheath C-terminal domain-containing protein [Anaerosalibacter sp. Marseille-P3206]